MSEALVQLHILIALWCGPVVSAGYRTAATVQKCRDTAMACKTLDCIRAIKID